MNCKETWKLISKTMSVINLKDEFIEIHLSKTKDDIPNVWGLRFIMHFTGHGRYLNNGIPKQYLNSINLQTDAKVNGLETERTARMANQLKGRKGEVKKGHVVNPRCTRL